MRIDEMPAGREMDALVAEKVMGFEIPANLRNSVNWGGGPPILVDGKSLDIPHYSTDLTDAWEVVEKMGNYLFACGRNDNGMWEACFFSVNSGIGKLSEGHGDTAPSAICRAALKALGVVGI